MAVKTGAIGFLGEGFGANNSGDETSHSVDEDERRELAGGEHIFPDRNLLNLKEIDDTLIDTLVMPTDNDDIFGFPRKGFESLLLEESATWSQIDFTEVFSFLYLNFRDDIIERFRSENRTRESAIRTII